MRLELDEESKQKIAIDALHESACSSANMMAVTWVMKAIEKAYDRAQKDFRVGKFRSKRDYNRL